MNRIHPKRSTGRLLKSRPHEGSNVPNSHFREIDPSEPYNYEYVSIPDISGFRIQTQVPPPLPKGGKNWVKRKDWSDLDIVSYLRYCKALKMKAEFENIEIKSIARTEAEAQVDSKIYERFIEMKNLEAINTESERIMHQELEDARNRLAAAKKRAREIYGIGDFDNDGDIPDFILNNIIPAKYSAAAQRHRNTVQLMPLLRKLVITITLQNCILEKLRPVNIKLWDVNSVVASQLVQLTDRLTAAKRGNLDLFRNALPYWELDESETRQKMEERSKILPDLENIVKLGWIQKQERAILLQESERLLRIQEQRTAELIEKMKKSFDESYAVLQVEWKDANRRAWKAKQVSVHHAVREKGLEVDLVARDFTVPPDWNSYPEKYGRLTNYRIKDVFKGSSLDKIDEKSVIMEEEAFSFKIEHTDGRPSFKGAFRGAYRIKNTRKNGPKDPNLIGKIFHYRVNPEPDRRNAQMVAKSTAIGVEFANRFSRVLKVLGHDTYSKCTVWLLSVSTAPVNIFEKETTMMIEDELPSFTKWTEPTGNYAGTWKTPLEGVPFLVASAFSHFSYAASKKRLLITDVQGYWDPDTCSMIVTDPALLLIHEDLWSLRTLMDANYDDAVDIFFNGAPNGHVCNDLCRLLNIDKYSPSSSL
ncbi:hypothetical protein HK098_002040 [Nowakowskiella sp. JEL0407]|nr:hypothetical protein HK098_002040 [Nowakowskiella sp. JEL0407]